ncbi:MAG TPA: hypothetical protein VL371_16640, partial [Gemmataceae bacterium]|nr:hypothetical protein [Gemmataceae bacterium]
LLGVWPLSAFPELRSPSGWESVVREFWEQLRAGQFAEPLARSVGLAMVLGGVAVFLVVLLLRALSGLSLIAGRRNAAATNAVLQAALVVVLLVGVNYWAFLRYQRYDLTRSRQFTLPPHLAARLADLRDPTTIVVYQRHKTFGRLSEKPDNYDYAAERKVVEKVQDLVDLFREFGPQFHVELLDVEEEGYEQKLARITTDAPSLKSALEAAPENSIFFYAQRIVGKKADGTADLRESVQRLSFNDFYQLDKTASQNADGGKGNLVLLPQGAEPFARRVLAIEEKKPKVGIAVIHEWLTTQGLEDLSMAGVRKALTTQGFEIVDLVLKKKWNEGSEPESAAQTFDESKSERLEEEAAELDFNLTSLQATRRQRAALVDQFRNASLAELTRMFRDQLGGRAFTEEMRKVNLENFSAQLDGLDLVIRQLTEERKQLETERLSMSEEERVLEERRMTDVRAKMTKLLSECDLLIVPRMTLRNTAMGDRIPARLYRLDDAQVAAIKEFIKSGKPVLAAFGPTNEPANPRAPMPPAGPDGLEDLLGQLGIRFGKQTVLFGADSKAFAERRSSLLATGTSVEMPRLVFEAPQGKNLSSPKSLVDEATNKPANPIATSMKVTERTVGGKQKLDLRLRHPRPIYFTPVRPGAVPYTPEFLVSDPDSWNEENPFPSRERTPRYEPPKADDPTAGTVDEKRRGPFPLGVAVETPVPAEWYDSRIAAADVAEKVLAGGEATGPLAVAAAGLTSDAIAKQANVPETRVRVAAIGHGGLFVGPELSPAKESLLLNTCNWLLGRDERLPHESAIPWHYPRVNLSEQDATLWSWGTLVALPGLFVYLGRVVLLGRRYR